jgi:hypothetical protein
MRRCAELARVICVALSVFLQGSPAQQATGAITGTIADPTGAAVAGCDGQSCERGDESGVSAQTKANGALLIPDLPAGTYKSTIRSRKCW